MTGARAAPRVAVVGDNTDGAPPTAAVAAAAASLRRAGLGAVAVADLSAVAGTEAAGGGACRRCI
ncbi:hypothetical protein [Pseudonocardia parietis]|uniref:Uncharacterized protein n=1 Tax=Pseudonocardia parietis TaxID=570936 RepID=A0ABS4VLV0_9PSEU|nr:hypothetical protein [Pseudonocardia parietis]MBP2364891.1 hypothetical protein [Pseudonocardia parietis]